MTTPTTTLPQADVTDTNVTVPTLAGDHGDDDGQVFDSLVEPASAPPPLPVEPTKATTTGPRPTTRLVTFTQTLEPSMGAVKLLNADADRADLTVMNVGAANLYLASEASLVTSRMGGAVITPGSDDSGAVSSHTGDLFAYAPDGVTTVSVVAVIK